MQPHIQTIITPTLRHLQCRPISSQKNLITSRIQYHQPYQQKYSINTKVESKQDLPNNYFNDQPNHSATQLFNPSYSCQTNPDHLDQNLFNMIVCTTCKDQRVSEVILGSTWNAEEGNEILKQRFANLVKADSDDPAKYSKSKQSPTENAGQTTPETNSPSSTSGMSTAKEEITKVPILFIAESEKCSSEMQRLMHEMTELRQKMKESARECNESATELLRSCERIGELRFMLETQQARQFAYARCYRSLSEA